MPRIVVALDAREEAWREMVRGAGDRERLAIGNGRCACDLRHRRLQTDQPSARLICTSRSFASRRPVGVAASPPPAVSR